MSIIYDPKKMLSKIAPTKKIKKLLGKSLSLKKTALSFVDDIDFVSKRSVSKIALKTIKSYKERAAGDPELRAELIANPKQLIQRVQNELVLQIGNEIKEKYAGEFYIWLPSDASEARPEHQLNYGKKFQIGVGDASGEDPGDAIGCRCGMEILVSDSSLDL